MRHTVPNFLNWTSIPVDAVLHPTFIWKLCYKLQSVVTFTCIQTFDQNLKFCLLYWTAPCWQAVRHLIFKIRVIFGFRFERRNVVKEQTYTKTEAYKLYSRVGLFWIFLPNFIKIDHYNFELYRFKVCAFLRHSVDLSAAFDTVHHNILLCRLEHA